jgi:hypothetical protein
LNVPDLISVLFATVLLSCVNPSIRSTWEPVTCLTPMVEAETCRRPALRRADKRAAIDMMGASVFDGGDGNLEM